MMSELVDMIPKMTADQELCEKFPSLARSKAPLKVEDFLDSKVAKAQPKKKKQAVRKRKLNEVIADMNLDEEINIEMSQKSAVKEGRNSVPKRFEI